MTAAPDLTGKTRAALIPLFLIAMGVVGIENALTRYFAVAKWSEYGYWIISIVMAGFALSGVVVALFRDSVARHGVILQRAKAFSKSNMVSAGHVLIAQEQHLVLQQCGLDCAKQVIIARSFGQVHAG